MKYIRPIVCAAALAMASPSYALFGGGGGMAGFSTEVTQLLNHAEMIANVQQAIQTAMNTMRQVQQLDQQLKSLPAGAATQILGDSSRQISELVNLYQGLNSANSNYQQLNQMVARDVNTIGQLNIPPSQYLALRASLAQSKGGVYQASLDADQKLLNDSQRSLDNLNNIIAGSQNIDSTVGGLQAIVQSNTQVLSALQEMKGSIAKANALAAQEKVDQANKDAVSAQQSAAKIQLIQSSETVRLNLPQTNQLGYSANPVQPLGIGGQQ